MSTNTIGCIGWCAAEQPGLKQQLEQAPVLQTESLGEPARGANAWEHWAVPNPDGKSWDVLQWYLEYNWGRQELFIIDLGTGQVKKGHPMSCPFHRNFRNYL